jgi:serine/threonine protein kinase
MEIIGAYRILSELARGNTGRVFLAERTTRTGDDAQCVLKVFDRRHVMADRFLPTLVRETPGALGFAHVYAARTLDVGRSDSDVFVAQEFVDGVPLAVLLDRLQMGRSLLPWEFAVTIGVQIARLMGTAHGTPWRAGEQRGLLHGHLGPQATYVTFGGNTKVLGVGLGRSRMCLPPGHATLAFRAPELLAGAKMSEATDVYGLGVTLHTLVSGERPFEGERVTDVRAAVMQAPLPSLRALRPEAPPALAELVAHMTAKDPAARPTSFAAIEGQLRSLLREPDAAYLDGLAQTMTIYFGDVSKDPDGQRDRTRFRRRLKVDTTTSAWPARPSRPPEESELSRARSVVSDVKRRSRGPQARGIVGVVPPLSADVIKGPWAAQVKPSLVGLDDSGDGFDVDSVVEAIVGATRMPPVRLDPLEDLVIEAPEELAGFGEVTPGPVEDTTDLLSEADRGLEAGAVVGDRYRILEMIGQGGASVVYRAEHTMLNKAVAVKVLRPELSGLSAATSRFRQEARSVCLLDHPNIVRVTDFGRTRNGSLFLVMDLARGICLADLLARQGALAPSLAISVAREVLAGLAHAHAHGVVHRDLKPDNIMVDLSNGRVRAKVLDFGIAKLLDDGPVDGRITEPGRVFGTPRYMAPEQASERPVDGRTDLYAVGVCLYEMLSGGHPFPGENALEVLGRVLLKAPPPLVFTPSPVVRTERLSAVVGKAMAKDPDGRFEDADEMSRALKDCFFFGPSAEQPDPEHVRP